MPADAGIRSLPDCPGSPLSPGRAENCALDISRTRIIFQPSCSSEGVIMRRLDDGAGCGARGVGDERSSRHPGGAGAPPAGTTTRCEELADGERPAGMSKDVHAEEPPSEARPGAGKERRWWSAERRPRRATSAARLKSDAPFGAPPPSDICSGVDPRARWSEGDRTAPQDAGGGRRPPRGRKEYGRFCAPCAAKTPPI